MPLFAKWKAGKEKSFQYMWFVIRGALYLRVYCYVYADNYAGSIDDPVEDGDTVLHLACLYGHLPCVQVYICLFADFSLPFLDVFVFLLWLFLTIVILPATAGTWSELGVQRRRRGDSSPRCLCWRHVFFYLR